MRISRPYPDALYIRDGRFANFIPALFGGALFKGVGKAIGWAASKVIPAASALISSSPANIGTSVEQEEGAEPGPYQTNEEELGDMLDVYVSDQGVLVVDQSLGFMSDEEFYDFGVAVANGYDSALRTIRDEVSDYEYDVDEDVAPRFANFKKMKRKLKKLKKVAKKGLGAVSGLAGKLGPLASLAPGLGTVAGMGLSAVGSLKSKARSALPAELQGAIDDALDEEADRHSEEFIRSERLRAFQEDALRAIR